NNIIDRTLLTHLKTKQEKIDSPRVCKNVISAFADSTLSLPVFNIGLNEQYRYWTPWGINFIEFSRQAAKVRTAVFVP
ncbi:hypothetical protein OFN50_40380, partial [Escherichia coli]|nr:hypothetical protein [Escherichia coli]